MGKIDFVPDDYIRQRESNKANLTCLLFFAVLMGAIGMTFSIIKIRQRNARKELMALAQQMNSAQRQIAQLEELKAKSKTMMKNMVMIAELLEPVPRSVILAALTNNLPGGVWLLETKFSEKEITRGAPSPVAVSRYQAAGAKAAAKQQPPQKIIETAIEITGIAPSDIEVATYIAQLSSSVLFEGVTLVESREHKIKEARFREFKLKTKLVGDVVLSRDDIRRIRDKRQETL